MYCWRKHLNLVLARTGLIFAAARRVVARTQGLFCVTSGHFPRMGKGSLLDSSRVFCSLWCRGEHSHRNHSLPLYTFVINVIAVTIYFLISLLFLVNCSDLNSWSSLFVTPVLLFSPKRERKEWTRGHTVWSVLVGTLNGRIPLLNRENN